MKYLIILSFLVISTTGCSQSLHQQVLNKVHRGDAQEDVRKSLGEPLSFQSADTNGVEYWVYEQNRDRCAVAFQKQEVLDTACDQNGTHLSAGRKALLTTGLMLKGMGDGMQSVNRNRTDVSCYSYPDPSGSYYTRCQ